MPVFVGVLLACGTAHAAPQVFRGHFDGGNGQLVLNERKASLSMDDSSCVEEVTNVSYARKGNVVVLLNPAEEEGANCHVILTVRGSNIISSYEEKCVAKQSNSCNFNITFH
ncbi:hypothetical protein JCM25156A_07990 [Komagataeibacter kakiaceti JCM 25156]